VPKQTKKVAQRYSIDKSNVSVTDTIKRQVVPDTRSDDGERHPDEFWFDAVCHV